MDARRNTSPPGDGKYGRVSTGYWGPLTQHIPARGRKVNGNADSQHLADDATHPRQGTERFRVRVERFKNCRRNTSPPGDGNKSARLHSLYIFIDATHPHQGTETLTSNQIIFGITLRRNTSPPGDGNANISNVLIMFTRRNTSPPEDGNSSRYVHARPCSDATHPRQGTETSCSGHADWPPGTQHNPARGRKRPPSLPRLRPSGRNTSPPGDGNGFLSFAA